MSVFYYKKTKNINIFEKKAYAFLACVNFPLYYSMKHKYTHIRLCFLTQTTYAPLPLASTLLCVPPLVSCLKAPVILLSFTYYSLLLETTSMTLFV